mmetsp:Transcript_24066/g.66874  ORF Transcript_24066/g.66874 Transcript_24066/m.66874 type:complete len:302 (-) Transcript_24066:623-1528(-)
MPPLAACTLAMASTVNIRSSEDLQSGTCRQSSWTSWAAAPSVPRAAAAPTMSAAARMTAGSPSDSATTWKASCEALSASLSLPALRLCWALSAALARPSMAAVHTLYIIATRFTRSRSFQRPTSPLTAPAIMSSTASCCVRAATDSRRPTSTSCVSSSAISRDTACGKAYSSTLAPVLPMTAATRLSAPPLTLKPRPASQGWMSGPPGAPAKPASSSSRALRRASQGPSKAPPLSLSRRRRCPSALKRVDPLRGLAHMVTSVLWSRWYACASGTQVYAWRRRSRKVAAAEANVEAGFLEES